MSEKPEGQLLARQPGLVCLTPWLRLPSLQACCLFVCFNIFMDFSAFFSDVCAHFYADC